MRRITSGLSVSLLLVVSAGCQVSGTPKSPPEATRAADERPRGADVDLELFYRELAPLGVWVDHAELGPVWYPHEMSAGWKPYLNGRWVAVEFDDGRADWLWASSEKHGWATHHYGRWVFLDSHGWVWAPDRTWGPANVVWRRGGGYVGWAAAPQAAAQVAATSRAGDAASDEGAAATTTMTTTVASTAPTAVASTAPATVASTAPQSSAPATDALPSAFTFVKEDALLDERLRDRAERVTRNVTLLALTEPAEPREIAEAVGERFQPRKIVEHAAAKVAELRDGEAAVYRPEVGPRPASPPPVPVLTRDPSGLAAEEARQRQAEYFDQLRFMMEERHDRERTEAKGDAQDSMIARQKREREALAEVRVREVEALRRRQREAREAFAAQEEQARLARDRQPAAPKKPELIPIPKEWELPPGMLRRD